MNGNAVQLITEDIAKHGVGRGPEHSPKGVEDQKAHSRYMGRSGQGSCHGIESYDKLGDEEGPQSINGKSTGCLVDTRPWISGEIAKEV
jgi:hypothetical protein